MLLKWDDFIFESLLLESALNYSDKFQDILNLIPDSNPIKSALVDLKTKATDIPNIPQNYIDVSDNKEEVSFIQDRRAQTILDDKSIVWVTNSHLPGGKYLSFKKDANGEFNNKEIFQLLGFTPEEPTDENHPVPGPNKRGEIVSEVVGPKTGKTFVLFKWNDGSQDRFICLNKEAIESKEDTMTKVYSTNRNNMRIGRLVGSILRSAKIPFTNTDIENFVNDYKSAWNEFNNELRMFDIVNSHKISYWYDSNNYEEISSTLGNSCMSYEECQNYFGIYEDNSDKVQLVILYSEKNGRIRDNRYVSTLIRGRALLWKTDEGDMFLDRIYTINDDDVELFKKFATTKGWWYKRVQNSHSYFVAEKREKVKEEDGTEKIILQVKEPNYTVTIQYADHEFYPYVDTLSLLRKEDDGTGKLANHDNIRPNYELRDTEGHADDYYN